MATIQTVPGHFVFLAGLRILPGCGPWQLLLLLIEGTFQKLGDASN